MKVFIIEVVEVAHFIYFIISFHFSPCSLNIAWEVYELESDIKNSSGIATIIYNNDRASVTLSTNYPKSNNYVLEFSYKSDSNAIEQILYNNQVMARINGGSLDFLVVPIAAKENINIQWTLIEFIGG
ncbi:hypothetical protein ACQKCU_24835 [Heyndrickxia sporothermodurans]